MKTINKMYDSGSRILITGSSGFVGQNLMKFFANIRKDAVGLNRKPKFKSDFSYSDLSNNILDDFEAIIHLAGKAHDLKNVSDESEYFEINTELTKKVFDNFLESKAKVFIYFSSVKAVADYVDDILFEDTDPNPITAYGKSKLKAEKYILEKEVPKNKRVYILRPSMIHGPGNKGNLNLLYSFVEKGFPYPFGVYENKRSFLSIDNLCFIVNELIESSIPSDVFNVTDDEALSTKDLIKIISKELNKNARIWNLPSFMIKTLAKLGDLLVLPINSEKIGKLTDSYLVSNNKLNKAIGKPLPVDINEGIIRTIKSFKN